MTALRPGLVRAAILLPAAYYCAAGALLFAVPRFFYTHIATIGDFNAHYARDIGSFLLPLGGFLVVAAWRPSRSRPLLTFAAVASGLHAVSHLIEGVGSWKALVALAFFVLVTVLLSWSALTASEGQ
jgi:hypothetical protein